MNKKEYVKKINYVSSYLDRLMYIAKKAVKNKKYNLALLTLASYCDIQYTINQVYTDKEAENLILRISKEMIGTSLEYKYNNDTVLFYDGFGLDLRGWAASFAKALTNLGYSVIYVVPLHAQNRIPHIKYEVERGNGTIEYIDTTASYTSRVIALDKLFNYYKPQTAFFYTLPNDVVGATVFDAYKGKVRRIQIDLTDHAFWIGINAFDYTIESRLLGLSNMIFHRGIELNQILITDCCPYMSRDVDSTSLPFNLEEDRFIFSGGSLYKTLGDEQLYFYKIVDYILSKHDSIKFLYAGNGDDRELKKILNRYPNRAFHIQERPDFILFFKKCIFFLNTYPMFGGLMMRYAALVGKIPLTLTHNSDHEGLLKNQKAMGIEYNTYEELIAEADRLIQDEQYRLKKESNLSGAVISEMEFEENLKSIIKDCRVANELDGLDVIEEIDTSEFCREYIVRLDEKKVIREVISRRANIELFWYFPRLFIEKALRRIVK